MSSQQEDEIYYVTSFLEAVGLKARPEPQAPGAGPDFLLVNESRPTGLEVTEVYRKPPAQGIGRRQMEGIRDQLLEKAKELWDSELKVPLEVHLHFDHRHTPFKAQIPDLAVRLVSIVAENIPEIGGHAHLDWDWRYPDGLPDAVYSVSIVRLAGHDRSYWFGGDADWLEPLSADHLQKRIADKNRKFDRYAAVAPETWLLVVLDSHRMSGRFGTLEAMRDHIFESRFARTVLFDTCSRRVIDLQTQASAGGSAA